MTTKPTNEFILPLRIILKGPPPGVDFGIQQGKGNDYQTISVQRSDAADLQLDCAMRIKGNRTEGAPNFVGPTAQGPPSGRFLYVDLGKSAGQSDSCWQRRIKIPLKEITWELIDSATQNPNRALQATIPGTGKDGGPSCATVRPIDGWKVVKTG